MKKLLRYGFTAIALAFVLSAFGAGTANAQINDILKRMDEHYKALKSLQANISREINNPQLGDDPDKMSGTISLLPGKGRNLSFRLDWTQPRTEIISVVNGQYVLYTPNIKQAYTGSSDSQKVQGKGGNALKVISMSKEEIKANYTVEYLGQEKISSGIPTWHLKLTPKVKADYKFADIWVDGNGMPLQAKITQSNDTTDSILLTNLKKNVSINGSIFKVSLPKDTKIVKS
ncbi:MAG TPA: outer-membrane lipoprotein carrier protein LolA [Pyrinomonadaceae bacterium]|nr:outer-membrane lipoprotein carrier protein LolA [Pyrinomonadaceae bacterium]